MARQAQQIFLLSPAHCGGERAQLLLSPRAGFPLAQRVHSTQGAPLGEVFSFLSGLYFRGKMAYASAFGRAPAGLSAALVISPCEGLRFAAEHVTAERLRAWAEVPIDVAEPRYVAPLAHHAHALAAATGRHCRFVLLGSIATRKYVDPLGAAFGDRLFYPADFVGRGDMSRGSIMLRAAREQQELAYLPVAGAVSGAAAPARRAVTSGAGPRRP
jgi:hypothetical protein